MGDISVEPSMEDILSSIKRIIAEEGDAAPPRQRRQSRAPAPRLADAGGGPDTEEGQAADAETEVLELNDPMPQPAPVPPTAPARREPSAGQVPVSDAPVAEPIVSQQTAAATRGSLDALSRLLVRPEPTGDGTLEGLVREMLRPMLREWLDANLPPMVEAMVAREIAKITGQPG